MKLDISTPLIRVARDRSLKGVHIALSASNSSDLECRGMVAEHLQQAMLELCRQLLVRGATLSYGGHLDAGGYTEVLLDLALTHRTLSELPPIERIRCYLAWSLAPKSVPIKGRLAKHQLAAKWIFVPRPPGVEVLDPARFLDELVEPLKPSSVNDRYAIARSMTLMREQQTADIDARVAVGGQINGYSGRVPGILEEVLLSMQANKPTFVIGAFGGAAGMIADLLAGKDRAQMTWHFHTREPHILAMRELYARNEGFFDYPDMLTFLHERGADGLNNGLTAEQNRELWCSRSLGRIVALVIEGLANIRGC
jgi:hypothetical protein